MSDAAEEPARPQLRIVRGDPTPDEVAALVVVLHGLAAASPDSDAPRPPSEWSSAARKVRRPLSHGLGGWRANSLPR